jgi:hypothetical protein
MTRHVICADSCTANGFFGFLAFVCTLDLISDSAADYFGWGALRWVTIVLEIIAVCLAVTMFLDLYRRIKN